MRRVFVSPSTAERICKTPKYDPHKSYRLTGHCLELPCGDGTLLFHTLTGVLMLLSHNESMDDNAEELVKNRFLVPEDFDENAYALEIRRILSLLKPFDGKRTSFTVLTTTDCNARCFYCYELGCKRITMSEKTARDAAEYIARVSRGEKVKLNWFGGEPLYNARAIDVICTRLCELGVDYSSSAVSNGYLFDEDTAARAVSLWRLKKAQISIDGTKERYQKAKAYIYRDDNAYERVMRNIENLRRSGVDVAVRLNMNRENAEDLLALCGELAERFGGKENIFVYPMLLKGFVGGVGEFETADEAVQAYRTLKDELAGLGLYRARRLERNIRFQRCMADNDACEVIMPDGRIGKCEHFDESGMIGTIYTDERAKEIVSAWKEQVAEEKCRTCPLFPRCIELKKCAWAKDGCSEAVRRIRIMNLKDSILAAYINEKNHEEVPYEDN